MGGVVVTLAQRFRRMVGPVGPRGCREWQGARTAAGYGALRVDGAWVYAHRLAVALTTGPIPHGQVVRHACDNPSCVARQHLLLGSRGDNLRDAWARGRRRAPRKGDTR